MTGTGCGTVARAHWRRLDRDGTDRCTLAAVEHGWILTGQAVWQEAGEVALSYAVRCDPDWRTLSADIAGHRAGRDVALRIVRTPEGWVMNDVPQPGLGDCGDIDLSFTPATNLMPLRRLPTGIDPQPVRAAWLVPGLDRLQLLDQSYARTDDDGQISYSSPGFAARLAMHPSGFVTSYPGLWDGWVDD